jgi:hypothetical protein
LISELKSQLPEDFAQKEKVWDSKFTNEITSLENVLSTFLPGKEHEAVRSILYG